jgi:hypothetical protein
MRKMTTEFTIERCLDDVVNTIAELNRAVAFRDQALDANGDEQESVDFFLDPTNLVYFSTPISSAIKSQDRELLLRDDKPFNVLVNRDIIHTYLDGGELVLVAAFANKFTTYAVGAFDRSTGLGVVLKMNWVDPEGIKAQVDAIRNKQKVQWELKRVVPSYLDMSTPVAKRSEDRLYNLLQDCRKHLITRLTGVDLYTEEE